MTPGWGLVIIGLEKEQVVAFCRLWFPATCFSYNYFDFYQDLTTFAVLNFYSHGKSMSGNRQGPGKWS
jgi:hypothetical protein